MRGGDGCLGRRRRGFLESGQWLAYLYGLENATRTSDFSSCSAFFTDPGVDPVEARYPSTEAGGERTKLTQVAHLFEPYEVVCHALEVGVYPYNDVERVCIFKEFS